MLIPHRISTKFDPPNGGDIGFMSLSGGQAIYCKDDKNGRPVRALEMISTRLAGEVGILTPDCAVVDDDDGNTYFGSVGLSSIMGPFEVRTYLITPTTNEFGSPDPWLGRYLASLYAFDLFIENPDRGASNFLMAANDRQLRAFDFASADLRKWSDERISIENTNTVKLGRVLRDVHGFDIEAALEMVRRLEAIPLKVFRRVVSELPRDWLTQVQGESLCDGWENGRGARLAALSAGLRDGSLL